MTVSNHTIFRVAKLRRPYAQLANAMLQDERLTPECLGVLCAVLSLPPDWTFHAAWFEKRFRIGRDKARRIIREAIELGYCLRTQPRLANGNWGAAEYVFTDDPALFAAEYAEALGTDAPETENAAPDKPAPGNPSPVPLQRKDNYKQNRSTKTQQQPRNKLGSLFERAEGRDADREAQRGEEREALEAYNAVARDVGLRPAERLTSRRRRLLRQALDAFGTDGWNRAMGALREAEFCQGKGAQGWKIDFDQLLDEDRLTRLNEGAYGAVQQPRIDAEAERARRGHAALERLKRQAAGHAAAEV